jgi:ATP-dependent Clp protease ATP-binding subunit ClpA
MNELRKYFKPEFINRIDEIVVFHSLSKQHILDIVSIQLESLSNRLQNIKIKLFVHDSAKSLIAEKGFEPVYGARPLKRVIQKELETPISRMIISGELKEGNSVVISANADQFTFEVE